jgi:two-component system chemotaxis sensor kinase CheA
MVDPGDMAGLAEVLRSLESIETLSREIQDEKLDHLLGAMKGYIEQTILGSKESLDPFTSGVSQLQGMVRELARGNKSQGDITSVLTKLSPPPQETKEDLQPAKSETMEKKVASAPTGDEDKEIIQEFVMESLDNLGTIEVTLLDLEKDSTDPETINAVFRPFHTIKGVSGFLNFPKINRLAHTVESLLDMARNGKLNIDGQIIDIVLESVDVLKKMIRSIQDSLEKGEAQEGNTSIEEVLAKVAYTIKMVEEGRKPLGEMLVQKGAVSREEVMDALQVQEQSSDRKIGEVLIEEEKVETKNVISALREQKRLMPPQAMQVRIDTWKLDNVVDMVGELAVAQSMLRQSEVIKGSSDRKLYQVTNQLNLITSGLQRIAMSLRMIPVGSTFQKMLRVVRDLAKKAGKDVQLLMSGEDTEIDRNMVEELYEPMVHMIRNAIDHGLEKPEERETAHKQRRGTIRLSAYYRGGDIVLEIADDGRGLNKEKILKKAISLGLVKEGDKLGDAEIHQLIFHPGFSTAEMVTDISGRGVGTDVVKNKVEKLRGRVEVQSVPGKGTTFTIRLPLTLAIMDGIIIKASSERYIIPTLSVQESFRPKKSDYVPVKSKGEVIKVRDKLIPLIHLEKCLGSYARSRVAAQEEVEKAPWERLVLVVESQGKSRCLLIDEVVGKEEVVIKSLGGWLKKVKGIAGGAILGDGTVGLILDVAGILDAATEA